MRIRISLAIAALAWAPSLLSGCGTCVPADELDESVWTADGEAQRQAWADMWAHVAATFGGSPVVAAFDLMVEPNSNEVAEADHDADLWEPDEFEATLGGTSWDWNSWYPDLVDAIRQEDPETPILVGANAYSRASFLSQLEVVDDPGVVYAVHQYEPLDYTHQDAWAEMDPEWDTLNQVFDDMDAFADEHGVALAVNEFGVHRFCPGGAGFVGRQIEHWEARGWNHAIWAWAPAEGFFGSTDFHLYYGPDPDSAEVVDDNALLQEVREAWALNTARPSAMGGLSKLELWTGEAPQLRGANLPLSRPWTDDDRVVYDGTLADPHTAADFAALAAEGANLADLSMPGLYGVSDPWALDEGLEDELELLLQHAEAADVFVVISFRSGPGRSEHSLIRDEVCGVGGCSAAGPAGGGSAWLLALLIAATARRSRRVL